MSSQALVWPFNCPKTSTCHMRWTLQLQLFNFRVHYRKGCWLALHPVWLFLTITTLIYPIPYQKWLKHKQLITPSFSSEPSCKTATYQGIQLGSRDHYGVLFFGSLVSFFQYYIHSSPLRGHLGRLKTEVLEMLEVAWLPAVQKDVWEYVKLCTTCLRYKFENTKPSFYYHTLRVWTVYIFCN